MPESDSALLHKVLDLRADDVPSLEREAGADEDDLDPRAEVALVVALLLDLLQRLGGGPLDLELEDVGVVQSQGRESIASPLKSSRRPSKRHCSVEIRSHNYLGKPLVLAFSHLRPSYTTGCLCCEVV